MLTFSLSFFSYEFKVKPKNELGEGPASEAVSFNTESGRCRAKMDSTVSNQMLLVTYTGLAVIVGVAKCLCI